MEFFYSLGHFPKLMINHETFLPFSIIVWTLFLLCRKISLSHVNWSLFLTMTWVFIVETLCILVSVWRDNCLFLYFFFYFNVLFIYLFIFLAFTWYLMASLMYLFTFSSYDHYYFEDALEIIKFKISKFFLTKTNSNFSFFKHKKDINKHYLKYSLNKGFNFYIDYCGLFYFFAVIFFTCYHLITIKSWYGFKIVDLSCAIYTYFNNFFFFLYFFFFLKLSINSLFFNKLLSINFLRFNNYFKEPVLPDDVINWEPRYYEFIMFTEEQNAMDSSIYTIDSICGDKSKIFKNNYWQDLDYRETYTRYFLPHAWLDYKTYSMDSYCDVYLQNILFNLDFFFFFIVGCFNNFDYWVDYPEIEWDLKLKI